MKRRGYSRRGYLAFILGVIIGFLLLLLISAIYSLQPILSILKPISTDTSEITFLYTSEKQGWIESVTPVFERWVKETLKLNLRVKLIVAGSHETVNLILHGSVKPTVWSPASSIWIPYLNSKWRILGYNYDLALNGTPLVYSPTVIAVWRSFAERYNITSLNDLYRIVEEGVEFRYGHPDPTLSNGGIAALLMEVAVAAGKPITTLTIEDLTNPSVQRKVSSLEKFAVKYGKSTGFFGRWATESGPQAIQMFIVYENVVVDNSLAAKRKWGDPLIAVYPRDGVFLCDHPYV
ncbi:MAG: substrate-binding domain-containing protein, partial [Nitrososphaerota archaeon]|nr:substrate-binding domain-containing protein [Candidatus Bathyarchaeota archaeon]MDW8062532.1 substrate-binding domain-containing protein [Nitrososphaerota archaeon]